MSGETALGPGREFDLVRALRARWRDAARGLGDDAAVLDVPAGRPLIVSVDTSIENVHFRRAWLTPREIGWRAAAAALSDLAAMGAEPLGMLLVLAVPPSWQGDVLDIADGVGDASRATGTPIVGGDLSRATELSLAFTVLGAAGEPLPRSGARPGDTIWVTGRFGGPLAALEAWEAGGTPTPEARDRFAHPVPRLREARWLAAHGAGAAIDISDGLLGDAAHVAAASGVRLELELAALPTVDGMPPARAARSGEEYELLVAAPAHLDAAEFARTFGVPLTPVGRATAGATGVAATVNGVTVHGGGFDHFA